MSWLMWEAKAPAERTDALLAWVLANAPADAANVQVYRSDDRVVLIAEGLEAFADPPTELVARPAYAWSFDRVR
jgi:hypothetical protein